MKKSIAIILCLLMLLPLGCKLRKETVTPSSGPELVEPSVPDEPQMPVVPDEPQMPAVPDEPASDPEPETPAEPVAPQVQSDLVFDTVTLYGEPISSDMIKDYDLVLVNFWADWCGWCVYEMPELERIHQEYPNVLILGVLTDPNSMEDSLQILKENNITFLTLEPAGTLVETANGLMAFPTTIFFDRNGNAVGEPIEGAQDYDGWKATVEALLP